MKIIVALIFTFPILALSQEIFSFPENLLADPYAYEIKQLKIKRIKQTHTSYWNTNNGFTKIDSSFYFDYIVEYDSLGRITSYKYDFELEYGGSLISDPEGSITVYFHNDSSRLERIIGSEDTIYYNYYENVFLYNGFNQIESIKVIRPYRSIIDGVYLVEHPKEAMRIEELYSDNLLIKRTKYANNVLVLTETFEYEAFKIGENPVHLLSGVTRSDSTFITVYKVSYSM